MFHLAFVTFFVTDDSAKCVLLRFNDGDGLDMFGVNCGTLGNKKIVCEIKAGKIHSILCALRPNEKRICAIIDEIPFASCRHHESYFIHVKKIKTIYFPFIAAKVTVDTHTSEKDIQSISDLDDSTCLTVPLSNSIQLIAEIKIKVLPESVSDNNVIINVQMLSAGLCGHIIFMNSAKRNTCEQNAKTEGEIGQLLASVPDSTACYYKIPLECRDRICSMRGYLAIQNNVTVQSNICGVKQG